MSDRLMTSRKSINIHIIAWAIFIIYEVFITGFLSKQYASISNLLIYYSLHISLFYFHSWWLTLELRRPGLFQKLIRIPLFIVTEIVCFALLVYFINNFLVYLNIFKDKAVLNDFFFLKIGWRNLYFIGFSTGYAFILKSMRENSRADQLEREAMETNLMKQKAETELALSQTAYLRSQINPHFLFNTLNYIYFKMRKRSPNEAKAILYLSEIMQYAVGNEVPDELTLLTDEITQVNTLIALYKLRTEEENSIELTTEGELSGIYVPALVLITITENMFKHGRVDREFPGKLFITFKNGDLQINSINHAERTSTKSGEGMGLKNIKLRLTSKYKDNVTMNYGNNGTDFYTEIIIKDVC